jgi:hypothetical protein
MAERHDPRGETYMTSAISSVASTVPSVKPEAMEPPGRDTKNDHDKDDAGGATTAAASSAPKPTVNTQGQALGAMLNTKA